MAATNTTANEDGNVVIKTLSEDIQFTINSTGADNVLWDFGDGETSTESNPLHTYYDNGEYNVTLTGYNSNGETSIDKNVTITLVGTELEEETQDQDQQDQEQQEEKQEDKSGNSGISDDFDPYQR